MPSKLEVLGAAVGRECPALGGPGEFRRPLATLALMDRFEHAIIVTGARGGNYVTLPDGTQTNLINGHLSTVQDTTNVLGNKGFGIVAIEAGTDTIVYWLRRLRPVDDDPGA